MGRVLNAGMAGMGIVKAAGTGPEVDQGQCEVYLPSGALIGVCESADFESTGDGTMVCGTLVDGRKFVVFPNGTAFVDVAEQAQEKRTSRKAV